MTDTNDTPAQEIAFHPTTNDDQNESNIEEFKEEEEEEGDALVIDVESTPGNMAKASSSRKSIQSSKSSTDGSERATSRPQKTAGLLVPPPPKLVNKSSKSPSTSANKKAYPSSQQNKKKKNKDFEDFEATGKWGQVSHKEMYVVGCVAVSVVIAIVVVVVVFVTGKKQQQENSYNMPPAVPTAVYPTLSQQEQLETIRAAVAENTVTASYASSIPATVDALDPNAWVDGLADPLVRAASWKVLQDSSMDASNRIMERFALAAIYFETVGEEWKNSEFWLNTDSNVCDDDRPWFGVRCINDAVAEIQLTGNNLQGNIPIALSLLPTLQSLWLDSNALKGKVNGDIFSAKNMPDIQFLYLQSNQLKGPIPSTFVSNGSDLRTIYIQGNDFTGGFPEEYCPTCELCPHPMLQFGLDCKKNPCPNEWCCDPYSHCFD